MADITVDAAVYNESHSRALRSGPVWVDVDTAYVFYLDGSTPPNLEYRKTSDGGATWGAPVLIGAAYVGGMSIWYDRWTPGNTGTLVHLSYIKTDSDDGAYYHNFDTADDSLGTEVTVFSGVSFLNLPWSSSVVDIVRARGGNLYIGFWGDTSGEFGFYRSTDDGVTWTSRAQLADGDAPDGILLMPGNESDEDDIWCIYWDRSANEISLKVYDNSGDSWSETSIATSMSDSLVYYLMSAAPRRGDNHVILVSWNEESPGNSTLKAWDIGSSSDITALTDIVSLVGESAQAAILLDQQNNYIYVAYLKGGTWEATVDVVYKKSIDGGTTWGDEQSYSEASADDIRALWAGISVGGDGGRFQPLFFNDDLVDLFVNVVNSIGIQLALPLRAAYVGASVDAVPSQGSARS